MKAALAASTARRHRTSRTSRKQAYIACDNGSSYGQRVAYLLGRVIVKGSQIDNASAQAPSTSGQGTTEWTVR